MNQNQGGGRAYWLYGVHAVGAALANPMRKVKRIVATHNALDKVREHLTSRHPAPEILETAAIGRIVGEMAVHQGAAIELLPLEPMSLEEFLGGEEVKRPLILLDQVTDPHNVGAILRSAAAFDAGAVIATRDNAPQETATLAKASSGGLEIVPLIYITNLSQTMETLKKAGYWCAGLDGEATQPLHKAKLSAATALVMGAEGKGLRRLTAERCDLLVKLPISARMESLNVSNAAAVALYELSRPKQA